MAAFVSLHGHTTISRTDMSATCASYRKETRRINFGRIFHRLFHRPVNKG